MPDGSVEIESVSWTPQEGLAARASRDQAPYLEWVEKGYLVPTPGPIVDYDYVVEWLVEQVWKRYVLRGVAYDKWNMDVFKAALDRAGVAYRDSHLPPADGVLNLYNHAQGFDQPHGKPPHEVWPSMPRSIEGAEALIVKGELRALRSDCLTRGVLSAEPIVNASGSRRLDKRRISDSDRIDPCIAMLQAVGLLLACRGEAVGAPEKLSDWLVVL